MNETVIGELERLSKLFAAGHLTEEEFAVEKSRLLGSESRNAHGEPAVEVEAQVEVEAPIPERWDFGGLVFSNATLVQGRGRKSSEWPIAAIEGVGSYQKKAWSPGGVLMLGCVMALAALTIVAMEARVALIHRIVYVATSPAILGFSFLGVLLNAHAWSKRGSYVWVKLSDKTLRVQSTRHSMSDAQRFVSVIRHFREAQAVED